MKYTPVILDVSDSHIINPLNSDTSYVVDNEDGELVFAIPEWVPVEKHDEYSEMVIIHGAHMYAAGCESGSLSAKRQIREALNINESK